MVLNDLEVERKWQLVKIDFQDFWNVLGGGNLHSLFEGKGIRELLMKEAEASIPTFPVKSCVLLIEGNPGTSFEDTNALISQIEDLVPAEAKLQLGIGVDQVLKDGEYQLKILFVG